jgi:hypothetical protein
LLSVASAHAAEEMYPANWCRAADFPAYGEFRPGRVGGRSGEKTNFYSDAGRCPSRGDAKCKKASSVVSGDHVIISRKHDGFTCIWSLPEKGPQAVGWVESSKLKNLPIESAPTLAKWVGNWKYRDNTIEIHAHGVGALEANATNAKEESFGIANKPEGAEYAIGQGDCVINLTLNSDHLIVADNAQCGKGRFNGVYSRVPLPLDLVTLITRGEQCSSIHGQAPVDDAEKAGVDQVKRSYKCAEIAKDAKVAARTFAGNLAGIRALKRSVAKLGVFEVKEKPVEAAPAPAASPEPAPINSDAPAPTDQPMPDEFPGEKSPTAQ